MLLSSLLLLPLCASAIPDDSDREVRNVAIVVYDGVELLDFAGPGEVFSAVSHEGRRPFRVFTVAESTAPITSQGFVQVTPQYSLSNCPAPDIVVMPGGGVPVQSVALREWLSACSKKSEVLMSVCNGALLLGAAGLLDGLEVTTHRSTHDSLQMMVPSATVLTNRRFIDHGSILTSAGVSAGIDGALHLVGRLHGAEAARATAEYMEYDWRPQEIARLHAQEGERVALQGIPELLELTRARGVEVAASHYRAAKKSGAEVAPEERLNIAGYMLLRRGEVAWATRFFEVVVALFPTSPNACDSLAEAFEKDENPTAALEWTERAMALLEKGEAAVGPPRERLLAAVEARLQRLRNPDAAVTFACPPCGRPCDEERHAESGSCGGCGMQLAPALMADAAGG